MHDLESLMVHRAPMLLLDELLEYSETYAVSEVEVQPEMMFMEAQGLPSWVGIELMAQTVSLLAGMRGKLSGQAPQIGFLLGTRRYHAPMSHFPVGSRLRIHVQESFVDGNKLGQYDCRIDSEQGSIEAKLNVYQPSDAHSLIKEDI